MLLKYGLGFFVVFENKLNILLGQSKQPEYINLSDTLGQK